MDRSVIKKVFVINVGSLLIISLLYALLIGWGIYRFRRLVVCTYKKVSSRFFHSAVELSRDGIEGLLNSFAMWERFYDKVRERDVEWLGEMMGEDVQLRRVADVLGIYLEDGRFLYGWGGRLGKERVYDMLGWLRDRFRAGEIVKEIPAFFMRIEGKVYLVGVCPLCDDSGRVLSHDFMLVGKSLDSVASLFPFAEVGGSLVVLDKKKDEVSGCPVAFCLPLRDYRGKVVAYAGAIFPREVFRNLMLIAGTTLVFVVLLLATALALAFYHRRLYREIRGHIINMIAALRCINEYSFDRERLDHVARRKDEIGYVASMLLEVGELICDRVLADPLTGILNRGAFFKRLEEEVARARRYREPLSLCLIDLDDFKQVNDKYGHPVGDRVLVWFAGLIRENIRSFDVFGRVGGEEFGVVFPKTDLQGAVAACEKLRGVLESASFELEEGVSLKITASFGLTCLKETDTLDSFYERADRALYFAKTGGKNRVVALS